jgi:hypothetical protein
MLKYPNETLILVKKLFSERGSVNLLNNITEITP